MPLCLVCWLVAIEAAAKGKLGIFFVAWVVALSSRQSALVWVTLPVGFVLQVWWKGQASVKRTLLKLVGLVMAAVLAYGLLLYSMNRTHAQAVMMPDLWINLGRTVFWQHLGLVMAVYVIAVGWGGLVLGCARFRRGERLTFTWSKFGAVVVVGLFWWGDARSWVQSEHPYWSQGAGACVFHALCGLAMVGWCAFGRLVLSFPSLLVALATGLLLGLRGVIWDYYLLEIMVLGFFGVRLGEHQSNSPGQGGRVTVFTGVLWVALLWPQARVGHAIKNVVDHNYGVVVLCEQAMRAGQITADELSVASFGYQGWCLYPYYIRHEGARGGYIADFQNYLRPGSLRMVIEGAGDELPSLANGRLRPHETLLRSTEASWAWTARRRFSLIRTEGTTPAVWPLSFPYVHDLFPLNDREWREKISARQPSH